MVIEWLKFRVKENSREEFIHHDRLIWTNFLRSTPGFLGKEVWIEPNSPDDIILIIKWKTRKEWKSIASEDLEKVTQHFDAVMNFLNIEYKSVGFAEYQIRKFA